MSYFAQSMGQKSFLKLGRTRLFKEWQQFIAALFSVLWVDEILVKFRHTVVCQYNGRQLSGKSQHFCFHFNIKLRIDLWWPMNKWVMSLDLIQPMTVHFTGALISKILSYRRMTGQRKIAWWQITVMTIYVCMSTKTS